MKLVVAVLFCFLPMLLASPPYENTLIVIPETPDVTITVHGPEDGVQSDIYDLVIMRVCSQPGLKASDRCTKMILRLGEKLKTNKGRFCLHIGSESDCLEVTARQG